MAILTVTPPGFRVIGKSENGIPAAFVNDAKRFWGVQFHPEVSHCQYGMEILQAFVLGICGARGDWNVQTFSPRSVMSCPARWGSGPWCS